MRDQKFSPLSVSDLTLLSFIYGHAEPESPPRLKQMLCVFFFLIRTHFFEDEVVTLFLQIKTC